MTIKKQAILAHSLLHDADFAKTVLFERPHRAVIAVVHPRGQPFDFSLTEYMRDESGYGFTDQASPPISVPAPITQFGIMPFDVVLRDEPQSPTAWPSMMIAISSLSVLSLAWSIYTQGVRMREKVAHIVPYLLVVACSAKLGASSGCQERSCNVRIISGSSWGLDE